MTDKRTKFCFHANGRPRRWLRVILVNKLGAVRPVFRRIVFKKNGTPRPPYANWLNSGSFTSGNPQRLTSDLHVGDWLSMRFSALRPLTIFADTSEPQRVNLVTDSISESSLFGGVGTALILSALWAKHTKSTLRIITRTELPATRALSAVLNANNLHFDGPVEFLHAPHYGGSEIAVGSRDLFLATSWWTARCLLNSVSSERIVYLLQEDERMFYPYGDDHLNCSATLAENFGMVVVNSELLYRHLVEGPNAVPGLATRATSFEPAFAYAHRKKNAVQKAKRNLFFYARPHNPRNLYATGLNLINQAIVEGVLDPKEWELHLVGKGLEKLVFDSELSTYMHEPMAWKEYVAFIQNMDAGLSLLYTPHPSYPPLDLASIGVPVLTNSFGIKTDLRAYSNNILCADLTMPALLDGFRQLIALAENPPACAENLGADRICHDWELALADIVARLSRLTEEYN